MSPFIRRKTRKALSAAAVLVVLGVTAGGQVNDDPAAQADAPAPPAVYGPWPHTRAEYPELEHSPRVPAMPSEPPPAVPSEPAQPPAPSPSPPVPPPPPSSYDPADAVQQALDALPPSGEPGVGRYALAIADPASGAVAVRGTEHFDTASIVKVDILAALLLQAQDHGTSLTAGQRELATAMIRHSDNPAADVLWNDIGGAPGLDAANRRLGLTETTAAAGGRWGLTQTTAADQLRLLETVFPAAAHPQAPLSAASRSVLSALMGEVVADQRWGISAAGDDPAAAQLKNGWLPRSTTGLWDVNSIGRVSHEGRTLLVVVLSDGQRSEQAGVDLVERAATAAATAMAEATNNAVHAGDAA